jgi:hypothetical protein
MQSDRQLKYSLSHTEDQSLGGQQVAIRVGQSRTL